MNDQVDQMIPPDIQTMDLIIEIKSDDANWPVWEKTNPIRQRGRSFCNTAVKNIGIVKMKGTVEGVGVSNNSRNDNNHYQQEIGVFDQKLRLPIQYPHSKLRKEIVAI